MMKDRALYPKDLFIKEIQETRKLLEQVERTTIDDPSSWGHGRNYSQIANLEVIIARLKAALQLAKQSQRGK